MYSLWPIHEPELVGTGTPLGTITSLCFTYEGSGGAFAPWHLVESFLPFYISYFALQLLWRRILGFPIAPYIIWCLPRLKGSKLSFDRMICNNWYFFLPYLLSKYPFRKDSPRLELQAERFLDLVIKYQQN